MPERAAKDTSRTVECIDEMLQSVYDMAIRPGPTQNLSAANAAALGIAKLHGLIVNKQSVHHGGSVTMKHEDALAELERLEAIDDELTIEREPMEIEPDPDVRH